MSHRDQSLLDVARRDVNEVLARLREAGTDRSYRELAWLGQRLTTAAQLLAQAEDGVRRSF
jgi:hypothetical protein